MANRTSYAPAGMSEEIATDEGIAVGPINPISPQIITETVTVEITRQGPNIKKKISS